MYQIYIYFIDLGIANTFGCSQTNCSRFCWMTPACCWFQIPPQGQRCTPGTASFLCLCSLPIENIGEVILIPVVGLFNVSLDFWLVYRKLNDFWKKNSRIVENYHCEKIIDQAKNSLLCYSRQIVTLDKTLPRQNIIRQNVTRKSVTRQNLTRQIVT